MRRGGAPVSAELEVGRPVKRLQVKRGFDIPRLYNLPTEVRGDNTPTHVWTKEA